MTRPGTDPVRIVDATLREGAQAPGVAFGVDETCAIASALDRLGVDAIECGHPAKSEQELARVRAVVAMGLPAPVLTHARAHRRDIDAARESGAAWVGLFLGVNEVSRRSRIPGRTLEELLGVIRDSVGYASAIGLAVRFTVEDASRTALADLTAAYGTAVAAGAGRLCFADTVGILDPPATAAAVSAVRAAFAGLPLEVHLHDDRGLALANALAARDAGAQWISCSVNGVGERCGIVDTLVLLANLHVRGEREIVRPEALHDASGLVARATGAAVPPAHPVTGADAFTHKARLHVLAMERDIASYSWTDPAALGRRPKLLSDES